MEPKDLVGRRAHFVTYATELFDKITQLSQEIRPDDKKRTGIQIYLREVGTRNLVFASIYEPSEQAQSFSVEKAVRSETLDDFSSQNSEDPDFMKFRGSLTILFNKMKIQASTSGLFGDEDAAVSLLLLSFLTQYPVDLLIRHITDNGGMLPECFFVKDNYLYELIYAD